MIPFVGKAAWYTNAIEAKFNSHRGSNCFDDNNVDASHFWAKGGSFVKAKSQHYCFTLNYKGRKPWRRLGRTEVGYTGTDH